MKQLAIRIGLDEDLTVGISPKQSYRILSGAELNIASQWYYLAILECIHLEDFDPTPSWIAKRLGLSTPEVKIAINRMLRAGYLSIDDDGKWVDEFENVSSQKDENVDEFVLREFQKQLLNLAATSIDHSTAEEKSHSSHTISLDYETIQIAKEEIKKFRRKLAKLCTQKSKNKEKLYCLQINFFEFKKQGDNK